MSAVILESVLTCPLRSFQAGNHAHGRLPVLLRMHVLPCTAAPETGRLLRILFIRLGAVSAYSAEGSLLLEVGMVAGVV